MNWSVKILRRSAAILLLAASTSLQPAVAQTDLSVPVVGLSKGRLNRQNKKNLQEAEKYPSDYKDTHLNTGTYEYKTGKSGRKAQKQQRKHGNNDENALSQESERILFKRTKRK